MTYYFYQKEEKLENIEKLVSNMHDKKKYVVHITTFRQKHEIMDYC